MNKIILSVGVLFLSGSIFAGEGRCDDLYRQKIIIENLEAELGSVMAEIAYRYGEGSFVNISSGIQASFRVIDYFDTDEQLDFWKQVLEQELKVQYDKLNALGFWVKRMTCSENGYNEFRRMYGVETMLNYLTDAYKRIVQRRMYSGIGNDIAMTGLDRMRQRIENLRLSGQTVL